MARVDVGEGRKLLETMTPGPWAKAAHGQRGGDEWWSVNRAHHDGRVLVVDRGRQVCRIMGMLRGGDDAAGIAWLRNNAPALLDEVEQLREHADKAVCAWCGHVGPKDPESMVSHQMACIKRTDAYEVQLRTTEAKLREAVEANAAAAKHLQDDIDVIDHAQSVIADVERLRRVRDAAEAAAEVLEDEYIIEATHEEPHGPELREVSDGWRCWRCEGDYADTREKVTHRASCVVGNTRAALDAAKEVGGG